MDALKRPTPSSSNRLSAVFREALDRLGIDQPALARATADFESRLLRLGVRDTIDRLTPVERNALLTICDAASNYPPILTGRDLAQAMGSISIRTGYRLINRLWDLGLIRWAQGLEVLPTAQVLDALGEETTEEMIARVRWTGNVRPVAPEVADALLFVFDQKYSDRYSTTPDDDDDGPGADFDDTDRDVAERIAEAMAAKRMRMLARVEASLPPYKGCETSETIDDTLRRGRAKRRQAREAVTA